MRKFSGNPFSIPSLSNLKDIEMNGKFLLRIRTVLHRFTLQAEVILLHIFTFLLLTDVLLGIAARYIDLEVVFADELGKYLFIWLSLIGISAATKDNQHVRLSFISARLPLNPKFIAIVSQCLFLIFTLFFLYWSCHLTRMHFIMNKSVMGFRFPMFWFTAALPFGFALTSYRLLQNIIAILQNRSFINSAHAKEVAANEPSL